MRIDLDCPVEVWESKLTEDGCEVLLYNLTKYAVNSVEALLVLKDDAGEEQARLTHRARSLQGKPKANFTMQVPLPKDVAIKKVSVTIEKLWYDGNQVWRRDKTPMTEFTSNHLKPGRELDELRLAAGQDAAGWPEETAELWLCVCGRPNRLGDESCIRCSRMKEKVFSDFSRELIMQKADERRDKLEAHGKSLREDMGRRQEQREQAYNLRKKRRRRLIAVAGCLVAAGGIAYGTVFHLMPYLEYQKAIEAFDAGHYETARETLAAMPGYREADDYVRKIRYLIACGNLSGNDEALLLSCRDEFLELGDYENSAKNALEADYRRAGLLLEKGSIEEASELYASLDDYADSPTMVTECAYRSATLLLDEGDFVGAREAFTQLGDYADSATRVKDCILGSAQAGLKDGDIDTALTLLDTISDYEPAAESLRQAHYAKAVELVDAGDVIAAGDEFLLAGEYSDAKTRAFSCIYDPAVAAMEKEDWYTAADLFVNILAYEDSISRWQTCIYRQAERAILDTEYIRASSLLSQLPEEYEGADELRKQCVYLPAVRDLNNGEYTQAIEAFISLVDYSDSAEQLQKARYGLAGKQAEEGNAAEALALYLALGDYLDCQEKANAIRYTQAASLAEAREWQQAIECFEALGEYKDSPDQLLKVKYSLAEATLADNAYDAAREQFLALADYQDAAQRADDCLYRKAASLQEAGSLREAAELYASIPTYLDAAERGNACTYQMAVSLQEAGSYQEAAALFATIPEYYDTAEKLAVCKVALAEELYANGSRTEAAELYAGLSGDDAAARAAVIYSELALECDAAGEYEQAEAYWRKAGNEEKAAESANTLIKATWEEPAQSARAAYEAGSWAEAVRILSDRDMSQIPEAYADLVDIWKQSCYQEGTALKAAGQDAAAYAYLQRCRGYQDTERLLTDSTLWKLCGTWQQGEHIYVFHPDGTCILDGTEQYYQLDGYDIATGTAPEALSVTHKIANLTEKKLTLRHVQDNNRTLIMNRSEQEELLPLPTSTAEKEQSEED